MSTRRGYNYEQFEYFGAPVQGWNPDAPPHELPDGQAPRLDNFMIRPGKVVMRAPIDSFPTLPNFDTPLTPRGGIVQRLPGTTSGSRIQALIAQSDPAFPNRIVEPWHMDIVTATTTNKFVLTIPNPVAVSAFGTASCANFVSDTTPGWRSINFGGLIYYLSTGAAGTSDILNSQYVAAQTGLCSIPSVDASVTPTNYALDYAPYGAVDLKGHLSRIWLLGGHDPQNPFGLFTVEPTTLFYTNPIAGNVGVGHFDWINPISLLTNKIVMDNNNEDYVRGLAVVRAGLVILRRNSLWILRGTTSASFSLQAFSRDDGCIDPRSILETSRGVVFLSRKGLMITDGSSVTNLSGPVTFSLQAAISRWLEVAASVGIGHAQCARMSDGTILVTIGYPVYSGGGPSGYNMPLWSGVLDPSTGVWTRWTSVVWKQNSPSQNPDGLPGPLVSNQATNICLELGDTQVTVVDPADGTGPGYPEVNDPDRPGLYDTDGTGSLQPIPAVWVSRFGRYATAAGKDAQMRRFWVDYQFSSATGADAPDRGWKVSPIDTTGSQFIEEGGGTVAPTVEAAVGASTWMGDNTSLMRPNPAVQRFEHDMTNEVTDMGFQVTFEPGSVPPVRPAQVAAQIDGIGVEFQLTHDRR